MHYRGGVCVHMLIALTPARNTAIARFYLMVGGQARARAKLRPLCTHHRLLSLVARLVLSTYRLRKMAHASSINHRTH